MNQQNFISSKVVLISEKASEILNSFNERLDKHDDNFQNDYFCSHMSNII